MTGKIFISYRHDDTEATTGRLYDRLVQTFGQDNLFMDVDHIPPGIDFATHLNNQVASCEALLAIIGPKWLAAKDESGKRRLYKSKDWVAVEIAAALGRGIRVIPVLVEGAQMPKESDLPNSLKALAGRQYVELRNKHFSKDADALVAQLRVALGDKLPSPRVRTVAVVAAAVVLLLAGIGGYTFFKRAAPRATAEVKVDNKSPPDLGSAINRHLIEVRDVKRVLRRLGMYAGPINNETDAAYFQAVGEFQRSQNIAQDGLVGPDTLKKLQAAWPEIFDPTTGSASSPKAPSTQPDTVALLQTAPADQTPQPGLSPSERYGIHLITSTDFKVAEENATKAKLVAPPGSKILLYKRKNSWWATVVIYSNNSTASADLSQYTKNNDWVGAQVVTLASWCPNATQYELMRSTADGGSLSALDCHQ